MRCAVEVIAEVGYPQASIRKIADRVGVAMSVVLYHFTNKDELVNAIFTQLYRLVIDTVAPVVLAETTASGKLRAYIRSNAAYLNAHRVEQAALLNLGLTYRTADGRSIEQLEVDPELLAELAPLDLETILRTGHERGELREVDPKLTALAIRHALNGAVLEVARDPEFDVIRYGEELVNIFDLTPARAP